MSDELNPGRDLRVESKETLLDAVAQAQEENSMQGCSTIIKALDLWIGGSDKLRWMLGQWPDGLPIRPDSVFLGASDALSELEPSKIQTSHLLAILTGAFANQHRIPNYRDFYQRVKAHLEAVKPPEDIPGLLMGFEPKEDEGDA